MPKTQYVLAVSKISLPSLGLLFLTRVFGKGFVFQSVAGNGKGNDLLHSDWMSTNTNAVFYWIAFSRVLPDPQAKKEVWGRGGWEGVGRVGAEQIARAIPTTNTLTPRSCRHFSGGSSTLTGLLA